MATNMGMIRTLFGIWRRLPQRLRSRLAWLAALGLAASMAQLAVVACIALLGTCLASPDKAYGLPGMDLFREFFPFMASAPGTLLATLSLGTVAVVGTNNALRAFNEYLSVRISREVERHIGGALLEGFLRMPYEWFLRGNSSDLVLNIYWASHYATVARMAVTLISEVASTLLILAGVFVLAPGFALAAMMFTGLLSVVLFRMLRRKLDKYSKLYRETTLERQRLLNVAMQGVKDVKVFHSEASLGRWCDELMQRSVSYAASQELARSAPAFLLEPLGFAIIMSVVAFLALGDAPSSRILGTASLMVAAGWKILPCVNKILTAVVSMRTSWPFLLKCEEDLAHVAENDARAEKSTRSAPGQIAQGFRDGLELNGVGFRYEGADEPSLCGFDLAIRKGEVVGIVGRSGAGKSTLVNVLAGLLLPSGGDMRVDGRALCAEDARRWKAASIGYVPQAPYIFDATLAENVAFGLRGAEIDRDRVLECCRMAAMDFLDDLPQGLDARIGERGLRLSGGQQQRVAIARALYKDPDIILFDEATSSLDPKSEQQILQTIYGLKGRKTMILVAHRLTTVEGCDRVCWVEQGRVRMEGSPAEVLPSYAALWLAPGADQ